MSTQATGPGDQRNEHRERYRELLEEFRTIIPGVNVLFAFLLTAPFSSRFQGLDSTGRVLYAFALVTSALSIVAFLTPASYHRVTRRSLRRDRLEVAVRFAVVGMALVALAIVAAILVVTRFIFGTGVGITLSVMVAVTIGVTWYALPILRRATGHAERAGASEPSATGRRSPP